MNVAAFAAAVFVILPLILVLGVAAYWVRPRHPGAGVVLGVAAIVLALVGVFVELWQYLAAAGAGAALGVAALVRPSAPTVARILLIVGAAVWVVAFVLLLVDAAGLL